jgi:hypothetical protein
MSMWRHVFALALISCVFGLGKKSNAQSAITFDQYSIGSVHYQGPGSTTTYASVPAGAGNYTVPDPYGSLWTTSDEWGFRRSFDEQIVDLSGNKVWRLSNAITGSFSNQPSTPSTTPSGEPGAFLWNYRGLNHTKPTAAQQRAAAENNFFHGGFKFTSVTGAPQANMALNISAVPRASSWRNSYLGITDTGNGFDLTFIDTDKAGNFPSKVIASNLSYADWHKVDIFIEFKDGLNDDGSGNDVVEVYLDDVLIHTGTTWETYYRQVYPATVTEIAVDALAVRSSGAAQLGNLGNGLYFDDFIVDSPIDTDGDGLFDSQEEVLGTDPEDPDSDDDGVGDGVEVDDLGTDPLDDDSDDDTLTDGVEVSLGTNPLAADTDGDSFDDAVEVGLLGSNPNDPSDPLDIGDGTISEALAIEAASIGTGILSLDLDLFVGGKGASSSVGVKLSLAKNAKAGEGRRTSLSNRMSDASKALAAGDYLSAQQAIESVLGKIDDSTSGEPDWIKTSADKDELYDSLIDLLVLVDYLQN